jgi:hypothetical protein
MLYVEYGLLKLLYSMLQLLPEVQRAEGCQGVVRAVDHASMPRPVCTSQMRVPCHA